jgi:acyl-CoA thioester hydrolase
VKAQRKDARGEAPGQLGTHALSMRVYYQHTDAGGVVYHGRYLDFLEAARTEYLQALGFDLAELANDRHVLFMVFRLEVDYRRPARLNDMIEVTAAIARAGYARLVFDQSVRRAGEVLVAATVHVACVDARSMRPVPVPEVLRQKVQNENQQ